MKIKPLSIIFLIASVVLLMVIILQLGVAGESNKPSRLLGIEKTAVLNDDATYQTCVAAGGVIEYTIPRVCVSGGKRYGENYREAEKNAYIVGVEKEAAQKGMVVAEPANKQLNKAYYPSVQTNMPLAYVVRYNAKLEQRTAYAYVVHSAYSGLTSEQTKNWNTLISAQTVADANPILGGNVSLVKSVDLNSKGYQNTVLIVDGEGGRVPAPQSLLLAGKVRDNFVLLQVPLLISEFDTMISTCIGENQNGAKPDKELALQECFAKKIVSNTALMNSVSQEAEKLSQIFAW